MQSTDLSEIRSLPLFSGMADQSYDRLMRGVYVQHFPEGLTMIRQGDPADFLHILLAGQVELFSSWAGRETTMAVLKPLGTFILAATIKDLPYLMSARTLERSRIMLVPSKDLRTALGEDPMFARAIIEELAGCYRAVVRHAKSLKLRNSRERIASYLMRQARAAGNASSFQLSVEKRLLASYLGMTAENLSRTLRSLESDGLKIDGTRVIIINPAKLMAVAQIELLMDGPDDTYLMTEGISLPNIQA